MSNVRLSSGSKAPTSIPTPASAVSTAASGAAPSKGHATPADPAFERAVSGHALAHATPTATPNGASPFSLLPRAESTELPARAPLATPLPLESTLALPFDAVAKLAELERTLGPEHFDAFNKLRFGQMLMTADAQAKLPPEGQERLAEAAQCIALGDQAGAVKKFGAWLEAEHEAQGRWPQDVYAYVQWVLRESYLIGTEQLRDYADKVEFYNGLKKKQRNLLEEARTLSGEWAGALDDSGLVFEMQRLDPRTGELYTVVMTEEDVENAKAGGSGGAGSTGLVTSTNPRVNEYVELVGPSRLTPGNKALLEKMIEDKGGFIDSENDDFVRENMDGLVAILPLMNAKELDRYLPKVLEYLVGGWTDGEEVVRIFQTLTPLQIVLLESHGPTPTGSDSTLAKGAAFGLIGLVGGSLVGYAIAAALNGLSGSERNQVELAQERAFAELAAAAGVPDATEVNGASAARILEGIKGQILPEKQRHGADGKVDGAKHGKTERPRGKDKGKQPDDAVGSPKLAQGKEALDAYIKTLEEDLNMLGDDAQLANLDLQNQLQKQQQLMTMMSNISKMLHDNAMSIIRNIGK